MWNNWLDKANEVALKAKEAAAQIEGQLNESVGKAARTRTIDDSSSHDDYYDNDDDIFNDADSIKDTTDVPNGYNNEEDQIQSLKDDNIINTMPSADIENVGSGWEDETEEIEDISLNDQEKEKKTPLLQHDGEKEIEAAKVMNETLTKDFMNEERSLPPINSSKNEEEEELKQQISSKSAIVEGEKLEMTNKNTSFVKEKKEKTIASSKALTSLHNENNSNQSLLDTIVTTKKEMTENLELHESSDNHPFKKQEESTVGEKTDTSVIQSPKKEKNEISVSKEGSTSCEIKDTDYINREHDNIINNTPIHFSSQTIETDKEIVVQDEMSSIVKNSELIEGIDANDDYHNINAKISSSDLGVEGQVIEENDSTRIVYQKYESEKLSMMESQILELQNQLKHREDQIVSHVEQMNVLQQSNEAEKEELRNKVRSIKEEAKKRIIKAKERVSDLEQKMKLSNDQNTGLVAELRQEGEALARKQMEMEKQVKAAKYETKELKESLNLVIEEKETAIATIINLKEELVSIKADLKEAQEGETRADKLDGELFNSKEDLEKKTSKILTLESRLKEYQAEIENLKKSVTFAEENAAAEIEREGNTLRQEKDKLLADLEVKLQISEKESNDREEALRREVSELRKRWQDAIRRADGLNMDLQQSTAPLIRQLESAERQNRLRAATWTEIEAKLRDDLEKHVVQNEKISKEKNEAVAANKRLERALKDKDNDLELEGRRLNELMKAKEQLEDQMNQQEKNIAFLQQQISKSNAKMKESDAIVRAEMMKTVRESEDFYQKEIECLKIELHSEREKTSSLIDRVEELTSGSNNANGMSHSKANNSMMLSLSTERSKGNQKLVTSDNQVNILQNTLLGLNESFDENENPVEVDDNLVPSVSGGGSLAHMEQLSQSLTSAKIEVVALKKQLKDSEKRKDSLSVELAEKSSACEELPELKSKVVELQKELSEKILEIQGLNEDMEEVRLMYRGQMEELIEHQAKNTPMKERLKYPENNSSLDIIEVIDASGMSSTVGY